MYRIIIKCTLPWITPPLLVNILKSITLVMAHCKEHPRKERTLVVLRGETSHPFQREASAPLSFLHEKKKVEFFWLPGRSLHRTGWSKIWDDPATTASLPSAKTYEGFKPCHASPKSAFLQLTLDILTSSSRNKKEKEQSLSYRVPRWTSEGCKNILISKSCDCEGFR